MVWPAAVLVGALAALFIYLRRRNIAIKDAPLSAEDQQQAERLLQRQDPIQ